MKDEMILLKSLYVKFESCTDIDEKLEHYYRATQLAMFLWNRDSDDMELFRDVEKMLELYYGKLLFCLFFEDIQNLNLTIVDNHINELTPYIKDLVLGSEAIFQLMHFKIDSIIKLERYQQKIDNDMDTL